MTQLSIQFNKSVDEAEKPRLGGQHLKIMGLLRAGPVDTIQLAGIGLQYNARIHELRKAGYDIRLVERNRETGVNVYELQGVQNATRF